MSEPRDDVETRMRAHFRERLADDEGAAPPFARSWGRARASARPRVLPPSLRVRWALAAGVACALAAVLLIPASPDSEAELQAVLARTQGLDEWEAPLDFLLITGSDLLETTPSWGDPAEDEDEDTDSLGSTSSRTDERMNT